MAIRSLQVVNAGAATQATHPVAEAAYAEDALVSFFDLYQQLVPQPSEDQIRALAFAIGLGNASEHMQNELVQTLLASSAADFERDTGLVRATLDPLETPDSGVDAAYEALIADVLADDYPDTDEPDTDGDTDPNTVTEEIPDDLDDNLPPVAADDVVLNGDDLAQLSDMFKGTDSNTVASPMSDIGMSDEDQFALDGSPGDAPDPADADLAFDGEPGAPSDNAPYAADDGEPAQN